MFVVRTQPSVESLRARIRQIETRDQPGPSVLPFGVPEIDTRLPGGGLALAALHEVAGSGNGTVDGAAAALFAAGIAARTRGQILWCVTRQDLFAPALAQAGLPPSRVIYVEVSDETAVLACFEEGLRHGGLGAVIAEVARLSMTASRCLQLAAEKSGTLGIRCPALAEAGRGRRFRPADRIRDALARDGAPVHRLARARGGPRPMACRTAPMSGWRKRGF